MSSDAIRGGPGDAASAARSLEAYFLRRVLSEVQSGSDDGLYGGGLAGSTFHEMLDEALADAMASGKGTGLAVAIQGALGGAGKAGAVPAARAVAAYGLGSPPRLAAAPVAGRETYGFGPRVMSHGPEFHPGVDIGADPGTPVRAAQAGVVVRAAQDGGYGNLVEIDHGGYQTRYGHLRAFTVRAGDRVAAGQQVGEVGSTGNSNAPHLHFEIRENGRAVDPGRELRGLGVELSTRAQTRKQW